MINNRVMGELAVSRAFGDVDFKKGLQVRITFFFFFFSSFFFSDEFGNFLFILLHSSCKFYLKPLVLTVLVVKFFNHRA